MRTISRQLVPAVLTTWRQQYQADPNFGYSLLPAEIREAVLESLVAEQRGLCSYTGIHVTSSAAHVEHLFPQQHCTAEEETRYDNLTACVPAPNKARLPYGAHRKDNWPNAAERANFLSPYHPHCEARFAFDLRGNVCATATNDHMATVTIQRLGLDHPALNALRHRAIQAALGNGKRRQLHVDAKAARARLAQLMQEEESGGQLTEFCFALKQAIPKYLKRIEAIRNSKNSN